MSFSVFQEILGKNNSSYSQKRHKDVYQEEVLKAYNLLGILPTATDADVKKSWKTILSKHHHDRHPNESEAKNRFCAEINNAYQLIIKFRAANN